MKPKHRPSASFAFVATGLGFLAACASTPSGGRMPAAAERDCREIQGRIDAAAAQGGGVVKVAAGTYVCEEPILLQSDNLSLIGETSQTPPTSGRENIGAYNLVTIKVADAKNIPAIVIGSIETNWDESRRDFHTPYIVRNIVVRNFNVDGNKATQSDECWDGHLLGGCQGRGKAAIRNNGITIRGAEDVTVSEVVLDNTRSGGMVTEKHCKRLKVSRMSAANNYFDGFAGYQTEDSEFVDSIMTNNRGAGLSLDIYFSKNLFKNVDLVKNDHQGVFARSLDSLTFDDVRIVDNGYQGLFFAPSEVGPCPTKMVLRNSVISGSGAMNASLGHGLRLAHPSCVDTCLDNVRMGGNKAGDVSWADKGTGPHRDVFDPAALRCQKSK